MSEGNPGAAQRRSREIYVTLRDRICLLDYPPGTKLSEQQLAREFDVSRTPIRRALHRLELEHLAERRQGVQTVVTDFDFESVRDIYAIRMVLAENLHGLSPARGWWRSAQRLRALRVECRELVHDMDLKRLGSIHLRLQEELAHVVDNDRAREIMMQLYFQIARIWLASVPSMDWQEEVAALLGELDALTEAMEHRDIKALGFIRRNHIAMNIERIRKVMDDPAARGTPAPGPT